MAHRYALDGLDDASVRASRDRFGSNSLPPPQTESFWDKLKDNYDDPLIKILLLALTVTMVLALFGFAEYIEGIGIGVAVFLATFVATYSEYSNESSFQALQYEASAVLVSVFRNGEAKRASINDVVRGDYVLLQAGDAVPADGTLVAGAIEVCQQSLTGEPDDVPKMAHPSGAQYRVSLAQADAEPASNAGFAASVDLHRCLRGSLVKAGEAVLLVEVVGTRTAYGQIADELAFSDERLAPLQVKLSALAEGIARLGYVGACAIALSFLFKQIVLDNGFSGARMWQYLTAWHVALHDLVTSVILAIIIIVVAVPEGLPMMIAIVLSLNMRKLLHHQVLVRRLIGIETAGSMDLLFADKTGTITEGIFRPRVFLAGNAESFYSFAEIPSQLRALFGFCVRESTSAIVNESRVTFGGGGGGAAAGGGGGGGGGGSGAPSDAPIVGGNPTDRALLSFLDSATLAHRDGLAPSLVEGEIHFSSVHKFSAVQVALDGDTQRRLFGTDARTARSVVLIKGAPEIILEKCVRHYSGDGSLHAGLPAQLRATIDSLATQGTRFIALALTESPIASFRAAELSAPTLGPLSASSNGLVAGKKTGDESGYAIPETLVLVGVVGLTDTLRSSARSAIASARSAGIQVVMITGDRLETAQGIANEAGLLDDVPAFGESRGLITSSELRHMSDAALTSLLPRLRVVARALPSDKSRLVQVAQQSRAGGRVVGMTGDGVNDTAALKRADVSFAMGSGSEVAKEASDVVILDSNIASIISAVLYGRTIFKSIRKFVVFQSTINLAATCIVFLGPFLGFDFPLTLIQLLWVNLVMDTLAALAFGGEPALPRYLTEQPISRSAPIFNRKMWLSVLCNGVAIACMSIAFLTWQPIHARFSRVVEYWPAPAAVSSSSSSEPDAADMARVQTPEEIAANGGAVFYTAFFSFFVFVCTFNGLNVRTDRVNILDSLAANRGFLIVMPLIVCVQIAFTMMAGGVLRVVPLTFDEWLAVIGLASLVLPLDALRKLVSYRLLARHRPDWLAD